MDTVLDLWRRFWGLSWWVKGSLVGGWGVAVVLAVLLFASRGGGADDSPAEMSQSVQQTQAPTAPTPTAKPLAPRPTSTPRRTCEQIKGTPYRDLEERNYYRNVCTFRENLFEVPRVLPQFDSNPSGDGLPPVITGGGPVHCYDNPFGFSCYGDGGYTNCYDNSFGFSCYGNDGTTNCYESAFGWSCY